MSEALLRQLYDFIDSGKWDEVGASFRLDGVYERSGFPPLTGAERIVRFYRHERGIARSRHTIEGVLVGDGQGAVWGHMEGALDSGHPISLVFADAFELDGDAIRHRRSHFYQAPPA